MTTDPARSVHLRPALTEDVAYILGLEALCMREYAEALWGVWRPSTSIDPVTLGNHQIIMRDGEAVGCIATEWHKDHSFIDALYVHPSHQNQGIGTYVLASHVELSLRRGLPTKLSVLTTNPAHKFYMRHGFTIESETAERRLMISPLPVLF